MCVCVCVCVCVFLQPVPALADAVTELQWLASQRFEYYLGSMPMPSQQFFDVTRYLEAMSFARVHRRKLQFLRAFSTLLCSCIMMSSRSGVITFRSSKAYEVALELLAVKAAFDDKTVAMALCKTFAEVLRISIIDGQTEFAVTGAKALFTRMVAARTAVTPEGVNLAEEVVALLNTVE